MVHYISDVISQGLRSVQANNPDWFTGVSQNGEVLGLEFAHPEGAKYVMRELYQLGVWAIFSTLDPRVLQYKPGILMTPALTEELNDRTGLAIDRAAGKAAATGRRASRRPKHGNRPRTRPQATCSSGRDGPDAPM